MKKLSIKTSDEDIEGQIDRLNAAVQDLMLGIEISAQTPRNPSRLSFAHPDWIDEYSDKSQDDHLPETFEKKFEEVLIQLDRCQMQNEDFWSDQFRKEKTFPGFINEEYVLKLEKENMELRSKTQQNRSDFTLTLKKSSNLEVEKKNFEEKLSQLDKLNDSYHQKQVQVLKVQESLRVKEKWIDHKEKELKAQWQNFEKAKQEWEKSKMLNGGQRDVKHNRLALSYEKDPVVDVVKPEAPPPETQLSREQTLKSLQLELQDLESQLKGEPDKEEAQRMVMKIDSLKNRIATVRGQKALFESSRSSQLINNMMKTMEKEVNYEENKRKLQLGRYSNKKNPLRESAEIGSDKSNLSVMNTPEPKQPRVGLTKYMDDKQVLDFRRKLLEKREREVHHRELLLQETWMKIPGSKELIDVVNLTLSKLTEQKNALDEERENFEKEKIEMLKIRDKLKNQVEKINSAT